ncbi:MAG: hypothetical protein ABL931_11930 [Usitatibacteraceae bacterium]
MLLLATALLLTTGVAHSYLGERYILIRLFQRENLPKLFGSTAFTIGTLRFVWHLTTVAWCGLAYLTFIAGYGGISREQVLLVVGVVALVSAAFPLYFTRGKHLSWIVFLAVGALVLVARGNT